MAENLEFEPDWASPPGDTITDLLEERALSVADFANALGRPLNFANDLLSGAVTITEDMAERLETFFGSTARFWLAREEQYQKALFRLASENPVERDWLAVLPINDMIQFGWIGSVSEHRDRQTACLNFFDVRSVAQWHEKYDSVVDTIAFRTSPSFVSRPGALAAWLRRGEIEASSMICKPWNPKAFRGRLAELRQLTRVKEPTQFLPKVRSICAECGVAVAIVRSPAGCRASGATYFVSPEKAVLLLSFRYLTDDHFWFTFFHEAGHLLLHNSSAIFLEGSDVIAAKEENEANEFAAQLLIPSNWRSEMLGLPRNGRSVIRFARKVGVSPGIVVGQLQHAGKLTPRQLNDLKRRFVWSPRQ